jgi:hypothetical protein
VFAFIYLFIFLKFVIGACGVFFVCCVSLFIIENVIGVCVYFIYVLVVWGDDWMVGDTYIYTHTYMQITHTRLSLYIYLYKYTYIYIYIYIYIWED